MRKPPFGGLSGFRTGPGSLEKVPDQHSEGVIEPFLLVSGILGVMNGSPDRDVTRPPARDSAPGHRDRL